MKDEILTVLREAGALSPRELATRTGMAPRTLRRKLGALVDAGMVRAWGKGPARRYEITQGRPVEERAFTTWEASFLYDYRPNETFLLEEDLRRELRSIGAPPTTLPAGTYARRILDRLLIDLSWNSSRLEGNTYSLLDTQELILQGKEADGKTSRETQMVLNHKSAIEFIVENADELSFSPLAIRSLHALLSENLLADPSARGRLRRIPVEIAGSTFVPLANPHQIEAAFEHLVASAEAIDDPFEASFFMLVQLPYLQPFVDVNKRVSRLAANLPFIRENYFPLSFRDTPRDEYVQAILAVYEQREVSPLAAVFSHAYRRSAEKYAVIAQSLGEPDPLRLQLRSELKETVAHIVRNRVPKGETHLVPARLGLEIPSEFEEAFRAVVEEELASLNEAILASYRLRPSEFEAWKKA